MGTKLRGSCTNQHPCYCFCCGRAAEKNYSKRNLALVTSRADVMCLNETKNIRNKAGIHPTVSIYELPLYVLSTKCGCR